MNPVSFVKKSCTGDNFDFLLSKKEEQNFYRTSASIKSVHVSVPM